MVAIGIAIEVEIGTIREKSDSDPDFDFDFERAEIAAPQEFDSSAKLLPPQGFEYREGAGAPSTILRWLYDLGSIVASVVPARRNRWFRP